MRTRTPPRAKPPEAAKQSPGFTVTDAALAAARRRPARTVAYNPFMLHDPPPGVLPSNAPKMAQDSSPIQVATWAASSIMASAYAEGTTFLGYSELAILAQRPEYRVASEEIAGEMTREWIEFESVGTEDKSEKIKALNEEMKRLEVRDMFRAAATYDGFYGRGHIYLDTGDTDDRDELQTPLGDGQNAISRAKMKKGKLRALRPVEPVWCYPTDYDSIDPLKKDWYRPKLWFVMGKHVHSTRLLTLIGREVPDLLKPAYSFGGLSMSQMMKPYVDNWLKTRQAVADLVVSFSSSGIKTNLSSLVQAGDDLLRRIDLFNLNRDNRNALVLDKDTEEWFNVSTPLSTLDQIQAQSQEHMAAVTRIPIVKLLGIQPAGLNASSEGEIRAFYDWIKSFQEYLFRKPLMTVVYFVMLSLWGEVDHEITFKFVDLWQLDEAARTAVEKTKTDIDDANVAIGAVSPEEVRRRLAADPSSQYAGLQLDEGEAPGIPGEGEEGGIEGMKPRDLHDPSERTTARAGNLASPEGGFGGGDMALDEALVRAAVSTLARQAATRVADDDEREAA